MIKWVCCSLTKGRPISKETFTIISLTVIEVFLEESVQLCVIENSYVNAAVQGGREDEEARLVIGYVIDDIIFWLRMESSLQWKVCC
jgi:hypothetical protein